MKKNHYTLFFILCMNLFLISCQQEEMEFIDETNNETITASSTLAGLLINTTQNAGSIDDIIDDNSCASIAYPVTVVVNGQQLVIEDDDDLQLIQEIFDLFPNDNDTLEIIFPIVVILEDFTQITVNDQSELQALIDACSSSDEITCLDIVYPITFFTYDASQQQTGTVTVNNDIELYFFLLGLDSDDTISIDFPISVTMDDGSVVSINSNQELQTAITDCVSNSGNNDPVDPTQFEIDLTTGVWYVTYFFDDYDETADFNGFEFTFATDQTAQAVNGMTIVNGTWNFTGGSSPQLDLFFGTMSPLDELDEDWYILEATADIIRLKHISGSDGSVDYLTYERTPNSTGSNDDINAFIENLTTGTWYVNLFDDGVDETCNYKDYIFTYSITGMVTAVSPGNTIDGYWTVEDSGSGLDFILNFDNSGSGSPLGDLNDDWNVLENTIDIIRLDDPSGGDNDLLTFGRFPPDCGGGGTTPDPQVLRDILIDGSWYISTFLDDGDDETVDYNGYDFNFFANETVTATNGVMNVPGIWIVSVVSDELNFEFDMDSPINGADDDAYKVIQYTETEVTLVTKDSGGNIEDTLIFKKN